MNINYTKERFNIILIKLKKNFLANGMVEIIMMMNTLKKTLYLIKMIQDFQQLIIKNLRSMVF